MSSETRQSGAATSVRRRDSRGPELGIAPPGTGGASESTREDDSEVRRIDPMEARLTSLAAHPGHTGWQDRVLRICDVAVAALALVVLSPVLLGIAVAIKLDSRGPVFYRQLRIGLDRRRGDDDESGRRTLDLGGQPFMMHKFRTMHVDAEKESGPVWAAREDHRVTRVGRFLRRHRLDELPQFWNVLKGEMSIVGPRPERPGLVSDLRRRVHAYQIRQQVRPGITGWAQINQESDQTVDDVRSKLEYDLEYIESRSISFDLRIMARTIPVMLDRRVVEDEGGARSEESVDSARRAVGA